MNELKNKLVPMKSLTEEEKMKETLELSRMSLENPPPKPDVLLSMGGTQMFTVGDISTVVSRAGHGKTTLLSLICGEMIKPSDPFFESQLSDEKPILYFDTEQADYDVWRVLNRLSKSTGLTGEELDKRILVYKTEHLGDEKRKDFVMSVIKDQKPQFAIIDGLTDLVETINEESIAKKMVAELRGLANEYKCHILSIVHANEGGATEEPRGWVGKEGVRKSEGVIGVKFDNKEFKVHCQKGRHGRFKDWTFELDQTTTVPYFTGEKVKTEAESNREEGKNALSDQDTRIVLASELSLRADVKDACENGATQKVLWEILSSKNGIGVIAAQKLIKMMAEDKIIFEFRGTKVFIIDPDQTEIYEPPNDEDDLPF